jgi:cytochrome c oxidase assembly protein subunit 15
MFQGLKDRGRLLSRRILELKDRPMESPWLHRYAVLLAAYTLLVVLLGAFLTTNLTGPPLNTGIGAIITESTHRVAAIGVLLLTLGLAIWLRAADSRKWLSRLCWTALAAAVLVAGLGESKAFVSLPHTPGILHACLAQLFFSTTVAMALFTSRGWKQGPEPVQDYGWPSMRSLAIVVPVLVFLQVTLGAAYRHQSISVLWHLLGAMLVSLAILVVCAFAMQQFPTHRALHSSAVTLISLTGAQVFLGLAVYTLRLETSENTLPVIVTILAHIATGAATLAASVVLGIQIRRNVHARVEQTAP